MGFFSTDEDEEKQNQAINPLIVQELAKKYPQAMDLGQYQSKFGNDAFEKAQADAEDRKSGLGWAQFAAGIGDALQGKSPSNSAATFNQIRKDIDASTVGALEKQRKSAIEDYDINKKMGQDSKKADIGSDETKIAQSLALDMGMDPALAGKMTAAQFEEMSPYLKAKFEAKLREMDRRDLNSHRNAQLDIDRQKLQIEKDKTLAEAYKKNNPNEKLKALSSTDKARYDNALMVAKSIDEMGTALDNGQNTFSVVGDNDYTAAELKAAEAYGRMQSGGAINKDEEKRFLKMLPRSADTADIQRKKLLDQRNEMISRLKTLGFTPEEIGYSPKEFKYGATDSGKTVVDRQVNKRTGQTRLVYSDGSTEIIQNVAGGK